MLQIFAIGRKVELQILTIGRRVENLILPRISSLKFDYFLWSYGQRSILKFIISVATVHMLINNKIIINRKYFFIQMIFYCINTKYYGNVLVSRVII